MPYITYSLYVSEAGDLFCIRHMEIHLESLSTELSWERGEWWLLPGWVWLILAHFLCCLDLCKAVFEPRGPDPIQLLSEVAVAMRWQIHSTAPVHSRECTLCTEATGHLGQAMFPAVRMPEFPSQPCHLMPPLPCVLPPLLVLLCGGLGYADYLRVSTKPGPTCSAPRCPHDSTCASMVVSPL